MLRTQPTTDPQGDPLPVATDPAATRRRDFLFLFGGVALTGYFVGRRVARRPEQRSLTEDADPSRPRLAPSVEVRAEPDRLLLRASSTEESALCSVNRPGAIIIEALDGRRTVPEIASLLTKRIGVPLSEETEAKVAYFVAELAVLGFLAEPFYVELYDRTEAV